MTSYLSHLTAATSPSGSKVATLDVVIIIVYLLGIVGIGLYAGTVMKKKKAKAGAGESRDYFLAGGTLKWPMIGLALFATNISCVHLVSLAQSGFDTGLLNGNFEWMAAFTLILLSLFFAPFYIKSKVATLPDFLEKRYNRSCRDMLAVFSLVSAVIVHIGFSFLTGGIVLHDIFGVNIYVAIIAIAILTAIYTIVGGLLAVVLTETIETIVLIIGATIISYIAYQKMGGWSAMTEVLNTPNALGETESHRLSMLRPADDPDGMPWFAILLGYPVLGIWYWCADQTIVQRVLGAKDENHARVGPLFAGIVKIIPVFIFVLPGLLAFTMFKTGKLDMSDNIKPDVVDIRVAYANQTLTIDEASYDSLKASGVLSHAPQRHLTIDLKAAEKQNLLDPATIAAAREHGEPVYETKGIYTAMITQLLPDGLKGVIIAALIAALMSTVSGALNSISTLTAYDLFKRFKPETPDHQLVTIGRIAAAAALVIAIGLVPLLLKAPSIFNALNSIIAHIAAPVTCVFLLGVFWKKANATSAQWTMIIGAIAGITTYSCNASSYITGGFMMMAFYLFVFCVVVQVTITLVSGQSVPESSAKLCWDSPFDPVRQPGWRGIGNYKFLAILLLVIMVILYIVFQ
ncbi:sodium/solute symporter [Verrucomicrobiaceae bacterium N1E253]|uniref:Sodium/solute symporter n=1 Tax=Oceaniferula marina TaxID=2748318 RepID=A0A851GEJ6_9BACT|nr:sodium/solute symporter [Oceaniferula marina]NWK56178.1 sodium/solute symporter [Oceaniferula marina]